VNPVKTLEEERREKALEMAVKLAFASKEPSSSADKLLQDARKLEAFLKGSDGP
jgi:hypothetical protein